MILVMLSKRVGPLLQGFLGIGMSLFPPGKRHIGIDSAIAYVRVPLISFKRCYVEPYGATTSRCDRCRDILLANEPYQETKLTAKTALQIQREYGGARRLYPWESQVVFATTLPPALRPHHLRKLW